MQLLRLGGGGLAVFLAVASLFVLDVATPLDASVQASAPRVQATVLLAFLFHGLGSIVVPLGWSLVAMWLWLRGRRWEGASVLVAVVLTEAVVLGLKSAFARDRPLDGLVASGFGSFPSGHTARAALTAALFVWLYLQRERSPTERRTAFALAAVFALGMAASRVILGVHWASDVLAGAALGLAGACLGVGVTLETRKALREPVADEPAEPVTTGNP